jgi:hypothetical protein
MTDVLPVPRRSGWLVAGLLLAVLALALATSGIWYWLGGSSPTYTTAEEKTYQHRIDRLVLDLNIGAVSVTGTTEPDSVELTREFRFTQRHRPSAVESWQGNALHIGTPRCVPDTGDCNADYTIRLPAGTPVEITTSGGDITTRGITGDQRLDTSFGTVRVAGSGRTLDVSDRGGDIIGTRLAATDTVVSTSGEIDLDYLVVPDALDATSNGGDIDVAVPRAGDGADAYRVDTGADRLQRNDATVDVAQDPAGTHVLFIRADPGNARVHY